MAPYVSIALQKSSRRKSPHRLRRGRPLVWGLGLLVAGCGRLGFDSHLMLFADAGPGDAGPAPQDRDGATRLEDAALPDAAPPDAAPPDAALPDAALPDAALPDAALRDAAVPSDASPSPDGAPSSDAAVDRCGNGTAALGEECDDGNLLPDDGCSPLCTLENQSPGADRCADLTDLRLVPVGGGAIGALAAGDTTTASAAYATTCTGSSRRDLLFSFSLTAVADLEVTVTPRDPAYDPAFFLMGASGYNCGNSSGYFGCTDDSGSGLEEMLTVARLAPGRYFVVVDAGAASSGGGVSGPFEISVVARP